MFLNETGNHYQYSIRMGKDSVPSTAATRSQFWVPGPDGGFISDLQYVRGFTQLQDLIDRAIMRVAAADSSETLLKLVDVGVYTQQFPYPCFIRDK